MLSQKLLYRVKSLELLIAFLKALSDELRYTLAPIDELFISLGEREEFSRVDFMFNTLDSMNNGEDFPTAFKTNIENSSLELDVEDKRIFKNLGDLLGATDLNGQLHGIGYIETLLSEQLNIAKLKYQGQGKIYRTLGVLSGLAIGIILI